MDALLILTADPYLAEAWQGLASAVSVSGSLDALASWRASGHRLVLVDLNLPHAGSSPLWQQPPWQAHASSLAILAASSCPDDDQGLAVLQAGACGYCHTHAPLATLSQALAVIDGGELWVGRALLNRVLRLVDSRLPRASLNDWAAPLSERERQVAQLAALGHSNHSIALGLGITERTVKAHLKASFDKLQVADRLQLALRVHGVS